MEVSVGEPQTQAGEPQSSEETGTSEYESTEDTEEDQEEVDEHTTLPSLINVDQNPEEPPEDPTNPPITTAMAATPKELALNKPTPFDGDPSKLEQFIMDCDLYLTTNDAVYNNANKKISFIMALLTEGNAAVWKMQYYKANQAANAGVFTAPTLATFLQDLRDSFKEVNEEGSSLICLERLQQGGKPVEEHNTKFKLLAGRTGITEDKTLVNIYQRTISKRLLEKIISHTPLPATLTDWMEKAVQLDKQWRMMMGILDKPTSKYQKDSKNKYKFKIPAYHDPNAMDVDALSTAERGDRKKGMLCYNCGKPGLFCARMQATKEEERTFQGSA